LVETLPPEKCRVFKKQLINLLYLVYGEELYAFDTSAVWNLPNNASMVQLAKDHMRKKFVATLALCTLLTTVVQCQVIDTLINVGGYKLNFHIYKGKGMPILFEGGAGADASDYDTILKPLADILHTTLIANDRPGYGKSELDTTNRDDFNKHGILQGTEGLEIALKKMGYDGDIMLVACSYGGFCVTLYAARHPEKVKAAVLIDCNLVCFFTAEYVAGEMKERWTRWADKKLRAERPASSYQSINLQNTVELMRKSPFPTTIPVIDLVHGVRPPFFDSVMDARWLACHRQFVAADPKNRKGVIATGSGHVIFRENPPLVIDAIVKAYAATRSKQEADAIMKRFRSHGPPLPPPPK
jgi:pimeloyl-ACP methyl ester carboxylesterase